MFKRFNNLNVLRNSRYVTVLIAGCYNLMVPTRVYFVL